MELRRPRLYRTILCGLMAATSLEMGLMPPDVTAQSANGLSLKQVIELALTHNPVFTASRLDLITAEEEKRLARAAFFPRIDLSETYMHTNNPVSVFGTLLNQGRFTSADFAVDRLNHPEDLNNFRSSIALEQPIFNGNQEFLGLRRAGIGASIAQKNLDRTRQLVIYRVIEAYYGLLLARAHLSLALESLEIAASDLRQIRSRFEQGLVVKSDLLRAEVNLADGKEEKIDAEHKVKLAKLALRHSIGTENDVEVSGTLEQHPGSVPDPVPFVSEAKQSRPDYIALLHQLNRAETEVQLALTGYWPYLNFQGNYELNNPTFTGDGSESYTFMAVLKLNLFSGLSDQIKVRRAKAQHEKTKALLSEKSYEIEMEVTAAHLDLVSAQERIKVREETVAQAHEHLRIIRNRYQAGLTTILDLLTAQLLLTQAKTARSKSLYDYQVALARLQLSAGRLGKEYTAEDPG